MYTILIVEDEPCIRENLAECLPWEQWGFSVLATAENGRAALEQMRHALPDVILTDIRMPVMDGIALLKSVRDAHPATAGGDLSGHDDFEYARQALELGAYAYVLKLKYAAIAAAYGQR
jgi:two-component system response regulator YesN